MKNPTITNANIFQYDWSANDRQKAIRAVKPMKAPKRSLLAPGVSATGIWMQDASILDGRSVKAYLAGKWSFRVFWWNLSNFMYGKIKPHSTAVERMYYFHKFHHFLTIGKLQAKANFMGIYKALMIHGLAAGVETAISQFNKSKVVRR